MKKLIPASAFLILLLALSFQFLLAKPQVNEPYTEAHLDSYIPADVNGWRSEELPLGTTELVQERSERILQLDEFLHRRYTNGLSEFVVYIGYWRPNKLDARLVASHTPDRCWTENGWQCTMRENRVEKQTIAGPLKPTEVRTFVIQGTERHTIFWHLIDGELYQTGSSFNAVPNPVVWLSDAVKSLFQGAGEQYFIRVDSSQPIAELWDNPGFQEVMVGLRKLGLAADAPAQDVAG